ncbi:MAG: cysteine synthase family protein [Treponema sp.]|nr:cysteine synthase family protein [Treponema sp.]
MKYFDSMQDLIGNTPVVRLGNMGFPKEINVFAKLELWNPAGSVKDRVGREMIEDAEEQGLLKEGGTIVEGTAGNTGLGIAFAALKRGYKVIFVVPTKFSQEKQTLMKALGAEIVNTPREEGMLGAAKKAEEIKASIEGAVSLKQFKNPANPLAHYRTTGPEIYNALDGQIDYFVAGAGSGGTYSGIMRYFKEQNHKIRGILADPIGSTMGGGEHGDYNIEGIGNDFVPETMDMALVDKIIKVTDAEAFVASRELARREGIIAGSSSGAAFSAVKKLALELEASGEIAKAVQGGKAINIVTLFPDRGDRYFSKKLYE